MYRPDEARATHHSWITRCYECIHATASVRLEHTLSCVHQHRWHGISVKKRLGQVDTALLRSVAIDVGEIEPDEVSEQDVPRKARQSLHVLRPIYVYLCSDVYA
jgi:hypothetical protein